MNARICAVGGMFILLAAACLRFWHLNATGWQYDEITYHMVASNLLHHGGLTEKVPHGLPYAPFLYQPPWYPYLLAGWFRITAATIYEARVLGVLLALCSLVLAWLLVRARRGPKVALFAAVPLAFDGWLLYVQRVSYIENLVLVVILAAFLLYQRALDCPSWQRFMLAGVFFGLAGCIKYTGVYVVIAAFLSWLIVRRDHKGHMVMLGTAVTVLGLDQLVLIGWWGNAYLTETGVQIRRVLGLQGSGGSLTSPGQLAHLLFAQYHIFAVSFLIGLAGVFIVVRYLARCYRARSWEPVRHQALLFSWAVAGCLTFGLSSLRLPQYFSLILLPLYLLFWTEIATLGRKRLQAALLGFAVTAGVLSLAASTRDQAGNPVEQVQQYAAAHIPSHAVVIADEQTGDVIGQPYCREQQPANCLATASYTITWNTYLQQTRKLGTPAYDRLLAAARPVWSAKGFSGTVTVWKLARPGPVAGVDVEADQDYTKAQTAAYGRAVLGYVSKRLHATGAGIVWDLCSPGFRSDVVKRCKESLSPADVAILIREARADGLAVQLRPLVRAGSPSGWNDPKRSWEGHIRPASQRAWFASLLKAEAPYLDLLRGQPGAQAVTGTELDHVAASPYWKSFLAAAGKDCGCQATASAWDANYARGALPPARSIGVDWYPPLRLPASAPQGAVTAAWEGSLARFPVSLLERTTLDEVSIRATDGAYRDPADWARNGASDPAVQARYFLAACRTVARYHMQGIWFYEIPLNDSISNPDPFPAFFVGNAGSKAIAACSKILEG
jgi:4-amino-4-deoxy-L-arabinose transferase-like glycosyltransferase